MPALGHRGWLRIATETAYANNTPNAVGAQFIPVLSESFKNTPSYGWPEGIRAERVSRRKVQLGIKAGGGFPWEVDAEDGIGILLKNILPLEDFTDNGSGNGGTHIFTVGDVQLPPSVCLRVCRDLIAAPTNIWDFVGGRVKKLGFAATEGQTLRGTADISCQKGTPGAVNLAPSYTTQTPLVYHQGTITIANAAVAVKSFKLDIDSGLIDGRGQLGSQFVQQAQPGMYKFTGEIEAYFDSMDQVTAFLNAVDVDITLTFLGTALGTSTRTLKFQLPTCQFTGETPSISTLGEIMLKLPFTGYRSGNGATDEALIVTLINSVQQNY